jgi:hypothetical protein
VATWSTALNVDYIYDDYLKSIGSDSGVFKYRAYGAALGKASIGAGTTSGRDITYTITGYAEWQMVQFALDVGDLVWDTQTNAMFVIINRADTVDITLRALTGFDVDGNLLIASANTGTLFSIHTRMYTVKGAILYGDTTASNATMSNIARADAFSGTFMTNATNGVAVDDYVYINTAYAQEVNATGGKITTVTDTTFVVTGAFSATATKRRLPVFIHKAPAGI